MKIIIIGAGLLGTSTAYFLKQHGHDVDVFERADAPAMETSFANGGMLTPSQSEPWNYPGITLDLLTHFGKPDSPIRLGVAGMTSALLWGIKFLLNSRKNRFYQNMFKNARLTSYSMQVLRQLRHDLGLQYDERCVGTLKFFTDKFQYAQAIKHSFVYRELDIRHQLLDTEETLFMEPSLEKIKSSIKGGIYYPDDESGDAHAFCQLLARHAGDAGVRFHYGTQVHGFAFHAREITGITTNTGSFTADKYILAAGSYSPMLARTARIHLPVRPIKGYSLTMQLPGGVTGPGLPVIDESRHIAMAPLGTRLRIAGTAELNGYNRDIDETRINRMLDYIGSIYPEILASTPAKKVNTWSGLRPYSADGVPYIGPAVYSNLYMNTGHGHLGWSMCAGSGKLLADCLSETRPEIDLAPYRFDR